jgi:hypothetical protein
MQRASKNNNVILDKDILKMQHPPRLYKFKKSELLTSGSQNPIIVQKDIIQNHPIQ